MSIFLQSSQESAFCATRTNQAIGPNVCPTDNQESHNRVSDTQNSHIDDTELDIHDSKIDLRGDTFVDDCNPESGSGRVLFVANLAKDCKSEKVFHLFEKYGEVVNVHLKYAKITKHPLGYGFVELKTHLDALNCINALDKTVLCGSAIHIGWASRNRKLFVSPLPPRTELDEVIRMFAEHGNVVRSECYIGRSENGGTHAVLAFESREDAEKARDGLNGSLLRGCVITIHWDQSMSARSLGTPPEDMKKSVAYSEFPYFSVHVAFRCLKPGMKVTEKMIYQAFRFYGNMTTVTIKTRYPPSGDGTSSGFGFVHFESIDGARSAVNFGHFLEIGGVQYHAEFSKHMKRRGEAKRSSMEGSSSSPGPLPRYLTHPPMSMPYHPSPYCSVHAVGIRSGCVHYHSYANNGQTFAPYMGASLGPNHHFPPMLIPSEMYPYQHQHHPHPGGGCVYYTTSPQNVQFAQLSPVAPNIDHASTSSWAPVHNSPFSENFYL